MALAFHVRPAEGADRAAIETLLQCSDLPLDGFAGHFPFAYVVAIFDGPIVGVAGLAPYGAAGLLRSVAVNRNVQGSGVGRALVEDRLRRARDLALDRVFLLTTTAGGYFRALEFEPTPRTDAPLEMQESPEFVGACPASAECLSRRP